HRSRPPGAGPAPGTQDPADQRLRRAGDAGRHAGDGTLAAAQQAVPQGGAAPQAARGAGCLGEAAGVAVQREKLVMRRLVLAPFLILLASPAAAADEPSIALVKTVGGDAVAVRGGERVALAPGAPLYAQDLIETGRGGSVGLTFKDGTRISLGPNT